MNAKTVMASMAVLALAAGNAQAGWQWVDDQPSAVQTEVYEQAPATQTRVYEQAPATVYQQQAPATTYYEERRVPAQVETRVYQQGPTYYEQQPRTYYRETYAAPVVTQQESFRDGRCDVTRTYYSNGSTSDDRECSRLMTPHEFIIDRIGRHFDRLRGY